MPRGIPNAKPANKATGAKPGPKTGAKALADKLATQVAASQPAPAVNQDAKAGEVQPLGNVTNRIEPLPLKGAATMSPVSPAVGEAIAKIQAYYAANRNNSNFAPRPYRDYSTNGRDSYLSVIGNKKGLRQTATLILDGEVLASTSDFECVNEGRVNFLHDGKLHNFPFMVECEVYVDLSEFTGVRLSPVDREEVEKIIANSTKTALALAEDEVSLLLQQERAVFKRGDTVSHMAEKGKRYLVVEAPQPVDPYRHRPQQLGRDLNAAELDMVVLELGVSYDATTDTANINVITEPKKVYSGVYMLAV